MLGPPVVIVSDFEGLLEDDVFVITSLVRNVLFVEDVFIADSAAFDATALEEATNGTTDEVLLAGNRDAALDVPEPDKIIEVAVDELPGIEVENAMPDTFTLDKSIDPIDTGLSVEYVDAEGDAVVLNGEELALVGDTKAILDTAITDEGAEDTIDELTLVEDEAEEDELSDLAADRVELDEGVEGTVSETT